MESDPLLAIDLFRIAIRLTSVDDVAAQVAVLEHHDASPSDALLRLIAAIRFGRALVVYYNWTLLGLLVCYTIWHHGRWHLLMRPDEPGRVVEESKRTTSRRPSSPSSTSTSSGTALVLDEDECRPLLDDAARQVRGRSWMVRKVHSARCLLMYQPRNLPLDKVLPSNLTTLSIVAFMGLNIFVLCYRTFLPDETLFLVAERTGLLFVANLPFLYILAAKNCPIRPLTGMSYENLNILHRRLGELMCLLALAHFVTMMAVFLLLLQSRGLTLWQFLLHPIIWIGISAFLCYEVLYLTSLGSFRQRWYEAFLASHVLLQAGGLGFLYFHFPTTRVWVMSAAAIFLIDRTIYRLCLSRRTNSAGLTVLPDGETILLSMNWVLPSQPSLWRRCIRRDILTGWHPTAHVFISCPSVSSTSTFQSHPFTIASSAPDRDSSPQHAKLDLLVRSRKGFTSDLLRHARDHSRLSIVVDGPYGSTHALSLVRDSEVAILVAGGSGIAVTFPLAWDLSHHNRPVPPSRSGKRRVILVWVIHSPAHIQWLGQARLDDLVATGVELIIPVATAINGRPDITGLLDDLAVRTSVFGSARPRTVVVVSGPDGMNRDVRNWCACSVGSGADVSVAVEKFGW